VANPTGTNLTASVAANIDPTTGSDYVWADGDDYELAQTDVAEGTGV
jgi:hypothetical protein